MPELKISDYLLPGHENAQTARQLGALLGISARQVSIMVQRERQAGKPIVATCDTLHPGYFLATSSEEMEHYCGCLKARVTETEKTLLACQGMIDDLPAAE